MLIFPCLLIYRLGIVSETGTPPIITGKDTGITGLAGMKKACAYGSVEAGI